jgi:type I restriction enzyme S subunit
MIFYKETDFQETPIGKIPKKWNITNLGSIAKIYAGNTAPQDEKYFKNGKYPFIRVQHLTELQEQKYPVKYDLINEYAISDLKLKKFKKGSIIFPKSGESIRLEKRAILKEDSYVVNHLAVVEPFHENIDNLFLFYYLCTVRTSNYLLKTTMPSLNLSTISNFLVPLPPIKEQQTIADILSTVDEAIQRTDEIIAKTERLKKALMNELLTGRIRVREENGKLTFHTETEFQETEIGKIPKEWEVVKLEEIIDVISGQYFKFSEFVNNGVKCLKIDNVGYGEVVWKTATFLPTDYLQKFPELVLKGGDIVMALNRPIIDNKVKVGMLQNGDSPSILYQRVGKIIIKDASKLDRRFLFFMLTGELFKQQLGRSLIGTDQPYVRTPVLLRIKILLPPVSEQQRIAEILSTVNKKLDIEKNEKAKLEKIKRELMDLLLTGKIRIKVSYDGQF